MAHRDRFDRPSLPHDISHRFGPELIRRHSLSQINQLRLQPQQRRPTHSDLVRAPQLTHRRPSHPKIQTPTASSGSATTSSRPSKSIRKHHRRVKSLPALPHGFLAGLSAEDSTSNSASQQPSKRKRHRRMHSVVPSNLTPDLLLDSSPLFNNLSTGHQPPRSSLAPVYSLPAPSFHDSVKLEPTESDYARSPAYHHMLPTELSSPRDFSDIGVFLSSPPTFSRQTSSPSPNTPVIASLIPSSIYARSRMQPTNNHRSSQQQPGPANSDFSELPPNVFDALGSPAFSQRFQRGFWESSHSPEFQQHSDALDFLQSPNEVKREPDPVRNEAKPHRRKQSIGSSGLRVSLCTIDTALDCPGLWRSTSLTSDY